MRLTAVLLGRKPLIHIVMASSVADVLAVTRYNAKQWETFKSVTASVAKSLHGDTLSPSKREPKTWRALPAEAKDRIRKSVAELLKEEKVPIAPDNVLKWRMHRIFKNMKRTTAARQARAAYESKAIAAGHGSELESHMWRFRRLVRDEMYALASTYPSLTWKELPTKQIHTIKERVNAQLREEGIPEVGEDLMFYQMEISLMAYKIRTNREEKEEAE